MLLQGLGSAALCHGFAGERDHVGTGIAELFLKLGQWGGEWRQGGCVNLPGCGAGNEVVPP